MKFLKNHPFAVEAYFESSKVLTFAVSKEQLQRLIPDSLTLDTFQDKWAFIAVAMVKTKNLRPKGFPKFLGNDFFLIGYRIFVRYTNNAGKRLRGLYIIRSETNKKKMELIGNVFTHYNYNTIDIAESVKECYQSIKSVKSEFKLEIKFNEKDIDLPKDSPFSSWKEARRYAGPLPHTFTYDEVDKNMLIVEGVRENWIPKPIHVESYYFEFLNSLKLQNVVLANAFEIENIPYYWKKGRIEKWS